MNDDEHAFITLAAFLKLHGVAGTGGQAKRLVRSGAVQVGGMRETRPGRKLREGDRVIVDDGELIVAFASLDRSRRRQEHPLHRFPDAKTEIP